MTLRLNGSTSGYSEIDAPATAGNNTIVLPAGNGAAGQLLRNSSTAGTLEFDSNVSIDSSGRLLIGTSSTSTAMSAIFQGNSSNASGLSEVFLSSGTNSPGTTGQLGRLSFSDNGHTATARIAAQRDGGTWTSGSSQPSALTFSTTADGESSPTERMRIESDGDLLHGKTVDNNANAGIKLERTGRINISQSGSASSTVVAFYRNSNSTFIGTISTTSTATAYNTTSDYRLKENVVDLDGAIDRLKQLPVHRFNFIANPDTVVDGFIAHKAQEVVPECVTGTKDEVDEDGNPVYQGIDQSKLVPLLTAALQEAIAKIETLEAKVAALEAS